MNTKNNLVARREMLVAQCAQQRTELKNGIQAMRHAVTPSGMGASLLEAVRQHKLLTIGGALALAFIKPRRLVAGLEMGWVGWEMWKQAAPMFQKIREHFVKA